MPKESAKERKEREKAEALALAQSNDRLQFESGEEKARQVFELQERVEWLEACHEFYHHLVLPSSRLMVRRTEYDELREVMNRDAQVSSARVQQMREEYLQMKSAVSDLQLELVHLRSECRKLAQQSKAEQLLIRENVRESLSACVERIEDDILHHRQSVEHCGSHLQTTLEDARMRSLRMARNAMTMSDRITNVMVTNTSMHTNIPRRIRASMERLEHNELMTILDALSFDSFVIQQLMYRFAPADDQPEF